MGVRASVSRVRKALAVAVAGVVVVALGRVGVDVAASDVETLVTFGVTSLLVWLVPNSKEYM